MHTRREFLSAAALAATAALESHWGADDQRVEPPLDDVRRHQGEPPPASARLTARGNLYFATAWPRPLILTTVIGSSMPRNSAVRGSAGYGSSSACTPG
jgi:hypothetical protein